MHLAPENGCDHDATKKGCTFAIAPYNGCEMTQQQNIITVLTGDIVNSTRLSEAEHQRAYEALERCAAMIADWTNAPLRLTRHRGDGWQVVITPPALGLRCALVFRAALKALGRSFDTTIGLGEGAVHAPVPNDLNAATEAPFVQSGRAQTQTKSQSIAFLHGGAGALNGAAVLAATLSDDWTAAQSAAIYHALHPHKEPNFTEIGERLGKSRQAATKALDGAKCERLRYALGLFESDDRYV